MLGKDGELLYVGKAKNLKNRISSYFVKTIEHPKTQALVSRIYDIETLVVRSETEALLLEQNLIKQHRPPYNVMLRDDKSYIYIFVSADKPYPRIASGRGKGKHQVGKFFGLIRVPITQEICSSVYRNYLMYGNVKILSLHSASDRVCNIKSNAVRRRVSV